MKPFLVVVESPAKASALSKFLGKDYKVIATLGHVRSLPSKSGAVKIDDGLFKPKYEIIPKAKKNLKEIKENLDGSQTNQTLYLATDMDREGEAIAWHLLESLKLNSKKKKGDLSIKRIVFHEITQDAILKAMDNPRDISMNLVNAQQARVILDYLYGFNLSPFLWRKVSNRLSAGRVQSVALRLICEREKEILSFVPEEYWSIHGVFQKKGNKKKDKGDSFKADLIGVNGKKLAKMGLKKKEEAESIIKAITAPFTITKMETKETKRSPSPPFITSTLQQEASNRLGFPVQKTMMIAQKLYEGKDIGGETLGLITYMRTDSTFLSSQALGLIKEAIVRDFGNKYALNAPRIFKKKAKNAQEAHEAIRPTNPLLKPESLKGKISPEEEKIYGLIWRRAIASQMQAATLEGQSIDIKDAGSHIFRITGSRILFPGFLKVYDSDDPKDKEEEIIPPLTVGEELKAIEIFSQKHVTQPLPRYSEATLVKSLEDYGIGRPSTYAHIINTLKKRDYVRIKDRRFFPEKIGMHVSDLLTKHFPTYVDYKFTAQMEENLDQIAKGEATYGPVLKDFWGPFSSLIKGKMKEIEKSPLIVENEQCPQCGANLVVKWGKHGQFLACSNYPQCKYAKSTKEATEKITCPQCKEGYLIRRKTKKGAFFFGCSAYPKCTYTSWKLPQ